MNKFIETQLKHRTIRAFEKREVPHEMEELLIEVARRTASSQCMQACSLIKITQQEVKDELAEIGNQAYIRDIPLLYVVVVDNARNARLASEITGEEVELGDMDRFYQGLTDGCLMAQNMVNAAESMGFGTIYLGCILNDMERLCNLLKLPKYTFPIVGVGFGYPDQEPQLKPRMSMEFRVFENTYPELKNIREQLHDYDLEMKEYYDTRLMNRKSDAFTKQVVQRVTKHNPKRESLLNVMEKQGFDVKLK